MSLLLSVFFIPLHLKQRQGMKANEFFRKIFSLRLWANLAAMLVVVVLLCLGVKFGIDLYTHHGEEIEVPDIKHKLFADAEHILEAKGLKIVVSDTGYVKTLQPDCILEQSPEPGKDVKSGRVIYVVINSSHSPMLTIPDIIDNCSYREARAKLTAMGFKVGPTEYIPGRERLGVRPEIKRQTAENGAESVCKRHGNPASRRRHARHGGLRDIRRTRVLFRRR